MKEIFVVKLATRESLTFVKKGKFHVPASAELQLRETGSLKGKNVIALIDPLLFYFSRETITKGPREVMEIQIYDKLEKLRLFKDKPAFFFKVDKETGTNVETTVIALEVNVLEQALSDLGQEGSHVKGFYHPAISISYLALKLCKEPVVAIWLNETYGYITITSPDGIYQIRKITFDDFMGFSEDRIREEVAFLLDGFRRSTGNNVKKTIVFGPSRSKMGHQITTNSDDLAQSLSGYTEEESSLLFHYPELFGVFIVPEPFNMVPLPYLRWQRQVGWGRKAAAAFAIISLINGSIGMMLGYHTKQLRQEVKTKESFISARVDDLKKEIPLEKIALINTFRSYYQAFQKEPPMDEFILWIAKAVPENFKISKITVSRPPIAQPSSKPSVEPIKKGQPTSSAVPTNETIVATTLNISMTISSITTFEEAHKVFNEVGGKIQKKYQVVKSKLHYDEQNMKAMFTFDLALGLK